MSGPTIFFSWQMDRPRKVNRDFIHDAAQGAIARIAEDIQLEDAIRLDEAAEGVSGVPVIGETILRKIDRCAAFIADVSFVGQTADGTREKKAMPNSNVLIELGYAGARIG